MRPETMKILDDYRNQTVLALEHAKKDNVKVVGTYCGFAPNELILAAGAIPVGLCGTRQEPIAAAEKILPRNLCPLIKSSFGFSITDTCPFFRLADFIIAETTCDGKKKMFELLSHYKPMHVMHLPPGADRASARRTWLEETQLLRAVLERLCEVSITDERLWENIRLLNLLRATLKELQELNKVQPIPLGGVDMLTAMLPLFFPADPAYAIAVLRQLIDEIKGKPLAELSPFAAHAPRILVTGCPVSLGSDKVVKLTEECGGSIVCFEMCTSYRGFVPVSEDESKDPIETITDRYLEIPCACMSPNPGRVRLLSELIEDYRVDGVIDITWHTCHTFAVEDAVLQAENERTWQLPFLHIETDYSDSDVEQLRTRIAAFIEMIG